MNNEKLYNYIKNATVNIMIYAVAILIASIVGTVILLNLDFIRLYQENMMIIAMSILFFLLTNPIWVIIIIGTFFLHKHFKRYEPNNNDYD